MARSMEKALLCAVLFAAVASSALAQTSVQCSAHAALEIVSTGGGTCSGVTSGTCAAFAESVNDYQEAFDSWFAGDYEANVCDEAKANAAAQACASATAGVYTQAFTLVTCDYTASGSACGYSQGNGEAWASATAEAFVSVAAGAGGDNADSFCIVNSRAISTVLVSAVSNSLSGGCAGPGQLAGGFAESLQISFQQAFAQAIGAATAAVCESGVYDPVKAASASVICSASATSDSDGGSIQDSSSGGEAIADGDVTGEQLPDCIGGVAGFCCPRQYPVATCQCPQSLGCEQFQYTRTSNFGANGQRRIWKAPSGPSCKCIN